LQTAFFIQHLPSVVYCKKGHFLEKLKFNSCIHEKP